MPSPLQDVRVVDLGSGAVAAIATMVLADFGADVIAVEAPGGDPVRRGAAWPMWLRGKRSLALDLELESARARLDPLLDGADVVVVSGSPGRAAALGVDYETLAERNPGLVHCSITPWGPLGPYAHYPGQEFLVAAKAGRMTAFTGLRPREGPAFAAVPVATHAASQGAVQGIVAALIAREKTGRGARVDTSLLQALMPYDLLQLYLAQLAEREPEHFTDLPVIGGGMPTLNYHPVMAGDGRWIQLGNLLEHLFYSFLDATGLLPELIADERFQGPPETWERDAVEEARDRILTRMQERTADEWMEIFRAHGNVAAEAFASPQQALHHPDLVANGDIAVHEHPTLGPVRQIGTIARLSETPGQAGGPAPAVGQQGAEVGFGRARRPALRSGEEAPTGRPLAGVTILELSTIIATPLATAMLADLGARVIKVEPVGGDPYRRMGIGPMIGVMAAKTNAGKESICIDLKSEPGRAIVRDLIPLADALVHNYRPGVPERLGSGWERARELRPDLVWVSANGYGPDSPSAGRPSAHPVPGAAMGGALHQAGAGMPPKACASLAELREVSRQLMRANEANPDPSTSAVIASATLLALLARQRFGRGQQVFVNMLVANAYANGDDFLAYAGKPPRATVDAELFGVGACRRLYPAREGWIFLEVPSDDDWAALCAAVARPDLARDPRFANATARREHDDALAQALAALFRGRDADSWEDLLAPVGVGCVRADAVTPGQFLARSEHVHQNGFAPRARHPRFGDLRRWGPLVTCDGGAERYGPGVLAGEHTDEILAELGRSPEEIERLRSEDVVWSEPA